MSNYKKRIHNLEKQLSGLNEIMFTDLLKDDFKYTGQPFEHFSDMLQALNVQDIPPYTNDAEDIILIKKGLLTMTSDEGKALKDKAKKIIKQYL